MARSTRSAKLETRTARLKLPFRKKPYFVTIAPGTGLGYRRNRANGTWVARAADGRGGNWTEAFATADDYADANGDSVLTYWEAQDRARVLARGCDGEDGKPVSVGQALDRYAIDLTARQGDPYNAQRVRVHLSDAFASKAVALLTVRELRRWRDSLIGEGLAASTVNRTCGAFQAALELAAAQDPRIVNQSSWRLGLASLPDAERSRNVILSDVEVLRIVTAAYGESNEFGLLVEVAAVTGARVSQLARLEVGDLQADRPDPRLQVPSARKGRGRKRIERRPVPISAGLAAVLSETSKGRPIEERLLTRPDGQPWKHSDHRHPFRRAVTHAGLDPSVVTFYALRHSSIVRALLLGVPLRVVAVNHDTSVVMLERTYSKHIGDFSDALYRRALLDTAKPAVGNVVALPVAR